MVITRMVIILWRSHGDSVESDNFYGDFMMKLVWRLSEVLWRKDGKSNLYQTTSILILP